MENNIKELDQFLDYLSYQKNYSSYTITSYQNDILEFLKFISSESLNFKELEYSDIRFYLILYIHHLNINLIFL